MEFSSVIDTIVGWINLLYKINIEHNDGEIIITLLNPNRVGYIKITSGPELVRVNGVETETDTHRISYILIEDAYQGKGLGKRLLLYGICYKMFYEELQGHPSVRYWVLDDDSDNANDPNKNIYTPLGFEYRDPLKLGKPVGPEKQMSMEVFRRNLPVAMEIFRPNLPVAMEVFRRNLPVAMGSLRRTKGKVYIGSMNLRGQWAPRPLGAETINVTSAQVMNANRRDFSPMTEVEGGYKGYYNFEAFWQSGKVYEDIPEDKTKKYWKSVKEAKRRYPGSKGKRVLYARFEYLPNVKLDYITSRKRVYCPLYLEKMRVTEKAKEWQEKVENGTDVVIMDFDGPRTEDGGVQCLEVTKELLHEKLNDPRFPFGHGYIVAAFLAGIELESYDF